MGRGPVWAPPCPPPVVTLVTPLGTAEAPPGHHGAPRASGEELPPPELVEVVVEAGAGDIVLAGGRDGIYVREAHRGSGLRQGDRLLSARVFFEDVRCEDAARVLRCAQPCRVSFCLKRAGPGGADPRDHRSPPGQGAQGQGGQAEPPEPGAPQEEAPPSPPVDVELALPKLALLPPATPSPPGGARSPRPPRVTVRGGGGGAGGGPAGDPHRARGGHRSLGGPRLPAVEVAVPKVGVPKVGVPKVAVPKVGVPKVGVPKVGLGAPAPKEVAPVAPVSPVSPVLAIAVPKVEVGLALPKAGAQGKLPKLGLSCPKTPGGGGEGEGPKLPGLEVAAPAVALEVALGSGGDAGVPEAKPPNSPPPQGQGGTRRGRRANLAPRGWELGGWRRGGEAAPGLGARAPTSAAGDPEARPAGRGGSAESLLGGPKNWGGGGLGSPSPSPPWAFRKGEAGGEAEGARKRPALKVPELELAAPGGLGGGRRRRGAARGRRSPQIPPVAEGEGGSGRG
ncbi:periaxin [Anser cygnoides]|uniref:periaxin n=1 Tax=Anser cygnoides TaxID=8845 RepID=UPI0034D1B2CE